MADTLSEEISNEQRSGAALFSIAASVFFVVCLWGIWTIGTGALGFNATLFLLLAGYAVNERVSPRAFQRPENRYWTIPLVVIAASYSLYENPFLKACNFATIPMALGVFTRFSHVQFIGRWSALEVLSCMASALFSPLYGFGEAIRDWTSVCTPIGTYSASTRENVRRVAIGIASFLGLAVVVVIPLLATADAAFADRLLRIGNIVVDLIPQNLIGRAIVFILIAFFLMSFGVVANRCAESGSEEKETDSVIAGIVLFGMLLLYGLFLSVQIERLWFTTLPTNFQSAESLVKGGFWQLIALSALNVVLFRWCYRRTLPSVQRLLATFTATSLLLVASSAHRMYLYVTLYGLSYEKFFASYSVLYCVLLFVLLLAGLVRPQKQDVVRTSCVLFIWMYAAVSLLPIEKVIFHTNVELSRDPASRIRLHEMQMLSADVLQDVISARDIYGREYRLSTRDWNEWVYSQQRAVYDKAWYEHTISSAFARWRLNDVADDKTNFFTNQNTVRDHETP